MPYHVENLLGVPIGVNGCAIKTACYLCKEEATAVPDAQGLIAAAAVARIMLPTKFPNHLCNGTMGIAETIAEARTLYKSGHKEGTLRLLLIAIAATARKRYPRKR